MKPIVLVDFSHLFSRNLFVAINQANPSIKKGKYITAEIEPYFKHLLFNSLQFIKNKFDGEIVLALDARFNWRKEFYKDYKGTRAKGKEESELNWEEIYLVIDEIVEVIQNNFPFKVVKVDKAEADDIGGVIAQTYGNQRPVILVTSDHDWLQNLTHGDYIKMYDPIKKEYVDLTDWEHGIIDTPSGEMSRFTAMHSLRGDTGDNVPKITFETEFSTNFISHLKENEITSTNVTEVMGMSIYDEVLAKYEVFSIVKSGKRKGQPKYDYRIWYRLTETQELITKDNYNKLYSEAEYIFEKEEVFEKDVFKSINFSEKKAKEAVETKESLLALLNSHHLYKSKFKFSNTLVDFDKIPSNIKENIIGEYNRVKVSYNQKSLNVTLDRVGRYFWKIVYCGENENSFHRGSRIKYFDLKLPANNKPYVNPLKKKLIYYKKRKGIHTNIITLAKISIAKLYILEVFKDKKLKNMIFSRTIKSNVAYWISKRSGTFYYRYKIVDIWGRTSPFSNIGNLLFPISPLDG